MIPVSLITLSGGSQQNIDPVLPEASPVARFDYLSSQWMGATARNTAIEPTSSNNAITYCFWVKGDNIDLQSGKLISIGDDSTSEAMYIQYITDSNVAGEYLRIRFSISGNSGSTIYKRILCSQRLLRNRWYFVCVSDSGQTGASAASGMDIWINGVKESSPTRQNAGTFAGGVDSSSNRLKFGRSGIANLYFGGMLRAVSIYNQVLSDANVLELYNNGLPIDPQTLSFWGTKGIEYFPLTSNGNGISMTMTNNGATFTNSIVSPLWEGFTFRKHNDTNTKYVAFGNFVNTTQGQAMYVRTANEHTNPQGCLRILPNLSDFAGDWANDIVINDGNPNFNSGGVGEDDTSIVIHYAKLNSAGSAFSGPGFRKSTDGKLGLTFDSYVSMAPPEFVTRFNFYQQAQPGFAAGEYFVPFYGHDGNGTFRLSVYRTTDNWATWTNILINQSTSQYGESCLLNCGNVNGNNTMLLVIRKNSQPYRLFQSVSIDGGLTWSTVVQTNLAVNNDGVSNVGMCINGEGKIDVVIMDRSQKYLILRRNNDIATVIAGATSWSAYTTIFRGYPSDSTYRLLGYPDIQFLGQGKYLISVSSEFSDTRADMFIGYGSLDDF